MEEDSGGARTFSRQVRCESLRNNPSICTLLPEEEKNNTHIYPKRKLLCLNSRQIKLKLSETNESLSQKQRLTRRPDGTDG